MKKKPPHGLKGKPGNRKGKITAEESSTKSIRLPVRLWKALKAESDRRGTTLNKLVRYELEKVMEGV
jgi:macrodomain Ter protein organizer (MatP/YcbG family)